MSDRLRGLVVASACTVALATGLWMLSAGVAHAVARPDGTDRAIMQRVAASAVKATLRVPAAAFAPGSLPIGAAHVVPAHADTGAGASHGRSRLYALFHVFQL